jgi:hypothetical protein
MEALNEKSTDTYKCTKKRGNSIKVNSLVQQGKSKKAKVKRKNADFVGCLAILNGWLISAVLY